jgi:hypothetical protein
MVRAVAKSRMKARTFIVVVWDGWGSYGTDTIPPSIQGQLYSTETIFADGFESGDTSAWSSTVQ